MRTQYCALPVVVLALTLIGTAAQFGPREAAALTVRAHLTIIAGTVVCTAGYTILLQSDNGAQVETEADTETTTRTLVAGNVIQADSTYDLRIKNTTSQYGQTTSAEETVVGSGSGPTGRTDEYDGTFQSGVAADLPLGAQPIITATVMITNTRTLQGHAETLSTSTSQREVQPAADAPPPQLKLMAGITDETGDRRRNGTRAGGTWFAECHWVLAILEFDGVLTAAVHAQSEPTAPRPITCTCALCTSEFRPARASTAGLDGAGNHPLNAEVLDRQLSQPPRPSPVDIYINGSKSTHTTTQVLVGAKIVLSVRCSGTLATGRITWAIPATFTGDRPGAVSGYTLGEGTVGAALEPFDPSQLSRPTFSIYFMIARTYRVTVTTAEGASWAMLDVQSPSVTRDTVAQTCVVGVNTTFSGSTPTGSEIRPPTLGLGLNDRCRAGADNLWGITWDIPIKMPKIGSGGQVGLTQLIARHVTFELLKVSVNGAVLRSGMKLCTPDIPPWRSDQSTFYANRFVQIGPGGTKPTWTGHDATFIPLGGPGGTFSVTFRAEDYIMFRPASGDAIWVPIGEIIWSWAGTATFDSRPTLLGWKLDSSSQVPPIELGRVAPVTWSAPRAWPQWSKNQPTGEVLSC